MNSIQGPAIFLAQFLRDVAPYNSLDAIAGWVSGMGYRGLQIPAWDKRVFDLDLAAESQSYCDDVRALLDKHGLVVTELNGDGGASGL
jgi:sugar phosphate isomerase/epimerase